MDSSITLPGGFRIGWDAVIGLIPGAGDFAGLAISLYIVSGAYRAGASTSTLIRMLLNIGIETIVGVVPILGDLFDMVFKANMRNMRLLENQLSDPRTLSTQSKRSLWLIAIAGMVMIGIAIYAMFALLFALVRWVF